MRIETNLKSYIKKALEALITEENLGNIELPEPIIERPKHEGHGDYSTNIAMVTCSKFKTNPRALAEKIAKKLSENEPALKSVEIAGPGFINIVLNKAIYLDILNDIYKAQENYGKLDVGQNKKAQVEYVSANPTGPLHVGHGRGAIYGDVLANLLSYAGYDVTKEYYLNDAGNQMAMLGKSVYLRIKELEGESIKFPEDCYQGDYIIDIADGIMKSDNYPSFKSKSEEEKIGTCSKIAGDTILEEIKDDLKDCGVTHDVYFSEQSLHDQGKVDEVTELLLKNDHAYEKDGALWFRSTEFGDDKDKVLKKSTGAYTYFATDIAYHLNKFKRGFERIIDIWGADHGGHVKRMKGAMESLGENPDNLDMVLIQLVNLMRGGEMVSMSTRSATYETLSSLVKDVGKDVCRYFFLMRSHNSQLDFDVELARKHSPENPVYYIQYAHARIASIFRKAEEEGISFNKDEVDLNELILDEESKLAMFMGEFPAVIRDCSKTLEPHKLSFYLLELAKIFQSYYTKAKKDNRYKVLDGSNASIQAKLYLLKNIQIVLKNGLNILGIDAPDVMLREEADAGL